MHLERLADYDQKILSIVEEKLKIYGEITGSAEVFNEARNLLNSDGSDPSKCGPILQQMNKEGEHMMHLSLDHLATI